jgi:hypothetical protein
MLLSVVSFQATTSLRIPRLYFSFLKLVNYFNLDNHLTVEKTINSLIRIDHNSCYTFGRRYWSNEQTHSRDYPSCTSHRRFANNLAIKPSYYTFFENINIQRMRNQHPHSDIEFSVVDEQRLLNIFLDDKLLRLYFGLIIEFRLFSTLFIFLPYRLLI